MSGGFEPTVLTDVTTDMVITKEETLGPVAPLYRFRRDIEPACGLAAKDAVTSRRQQRRCVG